VSPAVRAAEDDPVKLAPRNYRVKIDNREVRVLDVWLPRGAKTPMHTHPSSVIYVISGGVARFTDDHGHSTVTRMHAGQTIYRDEEDHMVQNVGRTAIHVLQVELKGVRFF
jgi:quercetin dioxygenase-like cupin family protein